MTETTPLVTINCCTYNQSKYIKKCLDGFVMQKTTFKFKAIVHDDASTDGTTDIVREYAEKYPDIIEPIIEKENVFSKRDGSLDRIMNKACNGKYVAFCEGDDYWIDPYKLQKQVDYMESHPDCVLCYSDFYKAEDGIFDYRVGNTQRYRKQNRNIPNSLEKLFYRILEGSIDAQTMTMLYRRSSFDSIIPNKHTFMMGDIPLLLDLSQMGKLHYIDEPQAVYNIHQGSACRTPETRLRFSLSSYEMRVYYCEKYGYKIPFYIKWRYNRAYNQMMAIKGEIAPNPMYELFFLNNILYNKHASLIKGSKRYRSFYIKVLNPLASLVESVIYRMKRL